MKIDNINTVFVVFLVTIIFLFSPIVSFVSAYLGGLILKLVFGQNIADGLNLIFNTTRFTPNVIPIACATFATIGRYFKGKQSNNNK